MLIKFFLCAAAAYLSLYVVYLLILMIANFVIKDTPTEDITDFVFFLIIIPAHNEALFIQRVVKSFVQQIYPAQRFKVLIVADNCTDNTAASAREAGVEVLERTSTVDFGKGYAIKYGLENFPCSAYDAVLIIDADSVFDKNGLLALNRHICQGKKILQCNNALANPEDSWFTLLMNVARTLGNEMMEPAKEKLKLSSHLMGNGMCFHRSILEKYGWNAFSVGEDWEYYAKMIDEGERIAFARDARVFHQESTSLKQATSQRMRWSSGRFAVLRQYGFHLLGKGIWERNFLKVDASLPLVFPNPSLAMNCTMVGMLPAIYIFMATGEFFWVGIFATIAICQLLVFVVAVFYTQTKLKSFLSIFIAPLFLVWKMAIDILSLAGKGREKWVRTKRHL